MNHRLHISHIIISACVGFSLFVLTTPELAYSFVRSDFGGPITAQIFCADQGSRLLFIGPPTYGKLMLTPASLNKSQPNQVLNLGQNMLAKAWLSPIPCTNSGIPSGVGQPIIFYGVSRF